MSQASIRSLGESGSDRIRKDLSSVLDSHTRRPTRVIIDEISGQFARVSERVWQRLAAGSADESLWQQARIAGWTRDRCESPRPPFSPLYFRLSLGSIDTVAMHLVRPSGFVFSSAAVWCWSLVIVVASILLMSRIDELTRSLGSLRQFMEQSSPLALGLWIVLTKVLHELGHAVMCRRMGSRCGSVGLLFLCGMPCPYCDVTDIWRQTSARRRAAVMMAGIYVELILASIATFVWIASSDPATRFQALNLILICGVSTIVFNANPLMRYDGYYILADVIGSPNLRAEASRAFCGVVTKRLLGKDYPVARRRDPRSVLLAAYHALAVVYRIVIVVSISVLIVAIAEYLNLRLLAVGMILLATGVWSVRLARRVGRMLWKNDHPSSNGSFSPRRAAIVLTGIALFVGALLAPLPRYRTVSGYVDAADAHMVFLASDGIIEEANVDFGDRACVGDLLVKVRDESLAVSKAKLEGQLRVASLRSGFVRRKSLQKNETTEQWQTLLAVENALSTRLASIGKRNQRTELQEEIGGIVLPVNAVMSLGSQRNVTSLRRRVGTSAVAGDPWCRVSPQGRIHAVLVINAVDRADLASGAAVRIATVNLPGSVHESSIASVSDIIRDEDSLTRRGAYHVLCPLPDVPSEELLGWVGIRCDAVFRLPNQSLAMDLSDWLGRWISDGPRA